MDLSQTRVAYVGITLLLASCGGEDSNVSRIQAQWRSPVTGPAVSRVDFTISQEEKAVSGIGDVKDAIYEFDGTWSGSFGPNDLLTMDVELDDDDGSVTGTGTLSTGSEDVDVQITGTRTGRSFQLSMNPAGGEPLLVSGDVNFGLKGILVSVEIENIPTRQPSGERRDLLLAIHGKRGGGLLDLFPSQ